MHEKHMNTLIMHEGPTQSIMIFPIVVVSLYAVMTLCHYAQSFINWSNLLNAAYHLLILMFVVHIHMVNFPS